MSRFLTSPRQNREAIPQFQRYGVVGMVLALGGTFIGMPAAFVFLAIAWHGSGGVLFWFLGLGTLAFGLWGMWQVIFGARTTPAKIPKTSRTDQ